MLREFIDLVRRGLLAGMGDVQPGETIVLRLANEPGQRIRAHAQHIEINEIVSAFDAVAARFLDMHGRGTRPLDAASDQAGMNRPDRRLRL